MIATKINCKEKVIDFNNWFADKMESLWIASYQLDLLEYYHNHEEYTYVRMEGFGENNWAKYSTYIP